MHHNVTYDSHNEMSPLHVSNTSNEMMPESPLHVTNTLIEMMPDSPLQTNTSNEMMIPVLSLQSDTFQSSSPISKSNSNSNDSYTKLPPLGIPYKKNKSITNIKNVKNTKRKQENVETQLPPPSKKNGHCYP